MKRKETAYNNSAKKSDEAMKNLKTEYMQQTMSIEQVNRLKEKIEQAKQENKREKNRNLIKKNLFAAAAVFIAFVTLPNVSYVAAHAMEQIPVIGQLVKVVTFRDYKYEDEQHKADVEIPELVVNDKEQEGTLPDTLIDTKEEINAEIQEITNKLLNEFVYHMQQNLGYKEIIVKSETVVTTPKYFTLKLSCYQGEASGYTWNYYYTIDLTSGKRLELKDIFIKGADYMTPINENIKQQMYSRMEADENVRYWLDDEMEEINFNTISDDTLFYINENNNVVICFNEGEVAPMYMGIVEFEIPTQVLEKIFLY